MRLSQENINKEVKAILSKNSKEFTLDEISLIKQYEPNDGQNKLYSFFTPDWLCDIMVKLAIKNGFNPQNGRVIEPSAGTGNFITALRNNGVSEKNIRAFELDNTNYEIAKILNPKTTIINGYFEQYFLQPSRYTKLFKGVKGEPTWSKLYPFDLTIGNPPYGTHKNRYSSYFKKPKFKQIEQFFIYKGLELLKKGGLLVYITGSGFMRGSYEKEKQSIGELAEFIDAYRMPKVFKNTQVPTDILIYKKK